MVECKKQTNGECPGCSAVEWSAKMIAQGVKYQGVPEVAKAVICDQFEPNISEKYDHSTGELVSINLNGTDIPIRE